MTIDIRGTSTVNKGAQLMLQAVVERFGEASRLSMTPRGSDFGIRSRLGMWQTLQDPALPRTTAALGNLFPRSVRETLGFVAEKEIEGVVDASGFRYSDSFNLRSIKGEALMSQRWADRGIPRVMLPQAYGPFDDAHKREWSRVLLNSASVIFVRDRKSAEHLQSLDLNTKIRLSPDFTIGLPPKPVKGPTDDAYAVVVPNSKLITQGITTRENYLNLLSEYGYAAMASGLEVVVMVHESGDRDLARDLASRIKSVQFQHSDPRILKSILGEAQLVIASRFHAVVSALSQSVPTVAIGWSHKYRELMLDFGVEHWLSQMTDNPKNMVAEVLADCGGVEALNENKRILLERNQAMWNLTEQVLKIESNTNSLD